MTTPLLFGPYGSQSIEYAARFSNYGANAFWFHGFDPQAFEACQQHQIAACVEFIPSDRRVQLILDALDFPDSLVETAQSPVPSWGLQMFGGVQVFNDPTKAEIFRNSVKKIQEIATF